LRIDLSARFDDNYPRSRSITSETHQGASGSSGGSSPGVVIAIGFLLALFAVATAFDWTAPLAQHGSASPAKPAVEEHTPSGEHDHHAAAATMPAYYAVLPFVLLLGAVAVFPLMHAPEHWWENNLHRFYVAAGLGAVTLLYYLLLYEAGGADKVMSLLQHALLIEYVPFIVLLFALYTISGGIRIEGDLAAHPLTNTVFMAIGGVLASFIGTTGAAMLLIRPLLETNRERKHVQHTVVFFIFIVCNCGGTLLPIGDPPLFMGYLRGVDFLWTLQHLWQPWLVVNGILLVTYYLWDHFFAFPRELRHDIARDETQIRPLRIRGLYPNVILLVGVILAVALLDYSKPFPGLSWRPWFYLREAVQIGLVALSLLLGSSQVRRDNRFNYGAIIEVAALFIGIFICMQPAIEILHVKGPSMGLTEPWQLFWATGSLSGVLDNAPTYIVFFETVAASFADLGNFAQLVNTNRDAAAKLAAVSLGAVFMGSMTYIGNGPNFMVKAIAEQSGVKMPSFFGYVVRFSIPILIPVFLLITVLFLL
jgi:Na+/H+ antiporter NhaD/arsenite permease-like protein